ncbi:MAG: hypothetical protein C0483_03765 [Pirellula sp.]|nr:hypothetical protein [Pirellula sp.]
MLAACGLFQPGIGRGQETAPAAVGAQQVLAQSATSGKFTYIVFYREDDQATRSMAQVVGDTVATQPQTVASVFVQISNPAEQAIVKQFDVSRAPMPLTMVTAPNGAITGVFPQRVVEKQLTEAYVTPAMSHCMKAMQQGKLVFLCLQTTPQPTVPEGVADFLADAQFKDRGNVVLVRDGDPAEAQLLAELQLGVAANQANTVFFAPPGVLVGKFTAASTKFEIAGALHKAGKCCDDPNCKHGHAHGPKASTAR